MRRYICLIALLLIPATAYAQVSARLRLINSTAAAATITGTAVSYDAASRHFVGRLTATPVSGTTPTMDCKIEHSPTGAAGTFKTLITFAQITTVAAVEDVHVNSSTTVVYPSLRAICTFGGTSPVYTAAVDFFYGK